MATHPPQSEAADPRPGEVSVGGRTLPPALSLVVFWIAVVTSLAHIYFNTLGTYSTLIQSGWHYAGFGFLCALLFPLSRRDKNNRLMLATDLALGLIVSSATLYLISQETAIYDRGVRLNTLDWICGVIAILGAVEYTRRTTGWIIPVLIILALSYVGWWGALIGGVFKFGGLSAETILFRSIYGDEGMFGIIARISSTFVVMFILFGAFLIRSGAGELIIDLARALAGRMVGGPGMVAVFASGLTGTISGSAVGNTASTGVLTIPLMKRSGFPPRFAAGVEASASTGGQLMPPIMGAGAFVMATFTQIPYLTIVAVSFLPALLFFMSVGFFVRIEARRNGVGADVDAPTLRDVMRRGGLVFLLPVALLIGLLVYGFTPTYAAGWGIASVVVASWLTPNRMGPRAILEALALGARNMTTTAVLLVAIGLVVNVIATTGIGNTFSLMIAQWASGDLLIALVLIALASLVLGMGLPVTAAYVVLATLSAPALYQLIADIQLVNLIASGGLAEEAKAIFMLVAPERLDALASPMAWSEARALLDLVPPDFTRTLQEQALDPVTLTAALLSAHMIIFWLSQDSSVTPPVCLTAFTAAAIAGTPPMATGLTAWKISKGLYIVPLLFAYTPFLSGDWLTSLEIFMFALPGLYAFSAMFQGHLERPTGWIGRVFLFALGLALLWPIGTVAHLIAAALFVAYFIFNSRAGGRFAPWL